MNIRGRPDPAAGNDQDIPGISFGRRVQGAIDHVLPANPTLANVAPVLGVQKRTLQRRLSAAGLTFRRLLDTARRHAAQRLLPDRSVSIGEIAQQLGYRDQAHFSRAFRRWTGKSPSQYRNQNEHGHEQA